VALSINQLKSGLTVLIDGQVYTVVSTQHVKPGKGSAFSRTKLRNLKTDTVSEKKFRCEERIEEAFVEQKKIQYLYNTHDVYHFMDLENYEEIAISKNRLKDQLHFLKDNLELSASFYDGELLTISLPAFVNFKILHTEAAIKGDTVKAGTKSATIETKHTIQVPLFIKQGDIVKIDTRTGKYLERAS